MPLILLLLQIAVGLVSLVCFILVLVQMFKHGQTGLAIACILLIWCVGGLIVLINGWMKAKEWGITNIMAIWTGAIVLGVLIRLAGLAVTQN